MKRSKQIYLGLILLLALSIAISLYQSDYMVTFLSAFGIGLIIYQLQVQEDVRLVITKKQINRKMSNKDINDYFVIFLTITNLSTYSQFYDIHLSDYIVEKTYKLLKRKLRNNVFLYSADQIVIIQEFEHKTVINQVLRNNEQQVKTQKILNYLKHIKFSPNNNLEYYQAKVIAGCGSNGIRDHYTTIESMIKLAHFTMLKAKQEDRDFLVATEETRIIKEDVDSFNQEMEVALEKQEFTPYFLPIFETNTLKIIGCESLLRWEKDEYRIIEASKFKDIASEKHIFEKIDKIIIEKSFENYNIWRQKNLIDEGFILTINLSKQSLGTIQIQELISLAKKYKIRHNYIEFDISEQDIIDRDSLLAIDKLKSNNFKVSIDAFYSNTINLKTLIDVGFDTIKLSRTTLPIEGSKQREFQLFETLTKFSSIIGVQVLAKGIESKTQLSFAQNLNTDYVQGYYFTPPLNSLNILGYLNKYRSGILSI